MLLPSMPGGVCTLADEKGMHQNIQKNVEDEEGIDEITFNLWKAQLEKTLPSFWKTFYQT